MPTLNAQQRLARAAIHSTIQCTHTRLTESARARDCIRPLLWPFLALATLDSGARDFSWDFPSDCADHVSESEGPMGLETTRVSGCSGLVQYRIKYRMRASATSIFSPRPPPITCTSSSIHHTTPSNEACIIPSSRLARCLCRIRADYRDWVSTAQPADHTRSKSHRASLTSRKSSVELVSRAWINANIKRTPVGQYTGLHGGCDCDLDAGVSPKWCLPRPSRCTR